MTARFPIVLLLFVVTCPDGRGADQPLSEQQVELFQQATDVLKENCLKCHAGSAAKSNLNLTTRNGILAGGEQGGAVFDEDDPAASGLLSAIRYESFEMPPNGQMSPDKIKVLEEWIAGGMPWPTDREQLEFEETHGPPQVNDETKQFWSFRPVTEPAVPSSDWGHNPIDAFISHRLQQNQLTPSDSATPQQLVRRMHYDLLGLPPDPAFVVDWSARLADGNDINQQAWSELIDLLLESPHYGEQWGRHWLDLVRYAETNSYERDGAKPFVWRYRDYVIQSFNRDKPYDVFVKEQLAGDELQPKTSEGVIATGYYRLGRWDDEPADPALAFYDDVDDIITTTSQTMLGLTVNCARCHDHKIDPIPQRDYYRMVGFFRQLNRFGVRSGDSVNAASVREVELTEDNGILAQERKLHAKHTADNERLIEEFESEVLPLLSEAQKEDFQFEESRLSIVRKFRGKELTKAQVGHYRNLLKRRRELRDSRPSGRAKVLCVTEDISRMHTTHLLTRGSPHAPSDEVTPGFPAILSPPEVEIPAPGEGAQTSGRRRILADWIMSPDNPLTARVMVNRLWQHHFGRGIVKSASDFGFQGTPPTHPQLLDWLAVQFVGHDWSIKQMHRLILTSATWQMSSAPRDDALQKDPVNNLFWRFDMRRLTAEEVRDSILWASGSLNTGKMFGPSIYTDIPDEVKAGQSRPGSGWGTSPDEDKYRRSIYIHVKRSLIDPLLESFDFADTDQTCPVRFVTTQPTQALGLLNSDFMRRQAVMFATSLGSTADVEQRVRLALTRVLQRTPTETEIASGTRLIEKLQTVDDLSPEKSLQYFCLVALNLNEFIYLD